MTPAHSDLTYQQLTLGRTNKGLQWSTGASLRRKACLSLLGATLLASAPALANKAATSLFELSLEELTSLSVSAASKQQESLLDASATTYVFTAEEIKLYGWRTLADVLRAVPNTDFSYNYETTSFNQRGFTGDGKQTLILVNGVENNEVFDFNAQLRGWYGANEIQRIEILMGPNSTLYGSSALFGVVNIVTRSQGAANSTGNLRVSYDEANNLMAEASSVKVSDNYRLGATFSVRKFENDWPQVKEFTTRDDDFSRTKTTDPFRDKNPENVRLLDETYSFDSYLEIHDFYAGVRSQLQDGTQGLDRTRFQWGENTGQTRRHTAFVGYNWQSEQWAWENRLSYRESTRDFTFSRLNNVNINANFVDFFQELWGVDLSAFPQATDFSDLSVLLSGVFSDQGKETAWQSTFDYIGFDDIKLKVGVDVKDKSYTSSFAQENRSRPSLSSFNDAPSYRVSSLYGQIDYQIIPDKLKMVAGVRTTHDNNPFADEKNFVTPRLSLIYRPGAEQSVRFTYNEGFRQEYRNDFPITPEYMTMYELQYSLQKQLDNGEGSYYLSVTPYHMKSKGLIRESLNPDQNARARVIISNGADYNISGVESLLRLRQGRWSWLLGMRYLASGEVDVKLLQEDQEKILKDVPRYKFQLGLGYGFEYLTTSVFLDYWASSQTETVYADHRTFTVGNSTLPAKEILKTDKLLLVNLTISSKDFEVDDASYRVFLEAYNLLDNTNYHVNLDNSPVQYMQPPRTLRFGFELAY
ncbi:TonB-dependent receptor [Simiduia sp. 21SJ11W-1]|uniref:TonB-dependent receptor plug domain-containing protein n=1 Tax=Simiduia sp. 21SJ11W-1 TaxID=2909669 RepID=UPI0020A1176C|nr:TonB-dependent receptor [Simiduia sp. 21SJ11W-1]UTA46843.1 TonB-dependent receptor [Simiduia sp. 21SJ11W-1]